MSGKINMEVVLVVTIILKLIFASGQGETWFTRNNSRLEYYLSPERVSVTFLQSLFFCKKRGGELALIQTNETKEFLTTLERQNGGSPRKYYIGLLSSGEANDNFYWIDGDQLRKSKDVFGDNKFGSPGIPRGQQCVTVRRSDTANSELIWGRVGCSTRRGFVCQRDRGLRGMWIARHSFEYYMSPVDVWKSYNGSMDHCNMMGGEPALIKVKETLDFVQSLDTYKDGFPDEYFIGLKRRIVDGQFTWNDDDHSRITNWTHGPENNISDNCVVVSTRYSLFKKIRCQSLRGYICQRFTDKRSIFNTTEQPYTTLPSSETHELTEPAASQFRLDPHSFVIGFCIAILLFIAVILFKIFCFGKKVKCKRENSELDNPQYISYDGQHTIPHGASANAVDEDKQKESHYEPVNHYESAVVRETGDGEYQQPIKSNIQGGPPEEIQPLYGNL